MADYKELLRRAVEALPENNGAARRAVYEKARAALVGQLRAIQPPLPARDITAHRLQLEDCIRQVEQESSEAVIAGMGRPELPPPLRVQNGAASADNDERADGSRSKQGGARPPVAKVAPAREPPKALPPGDTIEEIIRAANADPSAEVEDDAPAPESSRRGRGASARQDVRAPARQARRGRAPDTAPEPDPAAEDEDEDDELSGPVEAAAPEIEIAPPRSAAQRASRPLPAIVARAEAVRQKSGHGTFKSNSDKPYDVPRRGPVIEPRVSARGGQAAVARQRVAEPDYDDEPRIATAMSAVREVELEPQPVDPQGAIDRAIATLDREARGENAANDVAGIDEDEAPRSNGAGRGLVGMLSRKGRGKTPERTAPPPPPSPARRPAVKLPQARRPAESPLPVTGRTTGSPARGRQLAPVAVQRQTRDDDRGGLSAVTVFLIVFTVLLSGAGGAGYWAYTQGYLDLSNILQPTAQVEAAAPAPQTGTVSAAVDPATGPGNTARPAERDAAVAELAPAEDRLVAEPTLSGPGPELALSAGEPAPATEERLTAETTGTAAEAAVAALDPVQAAGSQSLLLEAADGGTGAIPFSGTSEWSRGRDEFGQPTLVGKANIPARNLGVDVLIRKNSDPGLPASHLMEINFRVSDGFVGGSIAGLPGVLLKNEELGRGTPLVGPQGVRVVGNSFLFALSALPADVETNSSLLTSGRWMDFALIYATGKRAIITLEKDATAEELFREVVATWNGAGSADG